MLVKVSHRAETTNDGQSLARGNSDPTGVQAHAHAAISSTPVRALQRLQAAADGAVVQRQSTGFRDLEGAEGTFHYHFTWNNSANSLHISFTDARETANRNWQFVYKYKLHADTWSGPHDSRRGAPGWAKEAAAARAGELQSEAREMFRALPAIRGKLNARERDQQREAMSQDNAFPTLGAAYGRATEQTSDAEAGPSNAVTPDSPRGFGDEDYGMTHDNDQPESDDMDPNLYA